MFGKLASTTAHWVQHVVTTLFLVMVLVGLLQIVNRYLPVPSMSWTEEMQRYLHIWLVFLAIPLAYRHRRHICVKLFSRLEQGRLGAGLETCTHALWLVLALALVVLGGKLVAVGQHQYSAGLGVKMAWIYLCQISGGMVLMLFALQNLIDPEGGES
jgi:TRAP-type C4-dicarboxylate transport system permease small subunit